MSYHYLTVDITLPYGESLTAITPITSDEEKWLETLNYNDYTDDDYISLDGTYISLPSVLDSLMVFKLPEELPIKNSNLIIEALKEATENPIDTYDNDR